MGGVSKLDFSKAFLCVFFFYFSSISKTLGCLKIILFSPLFGYQCF